MPCPHCGAENPPGTVFCASCGGSLSRATGATSPQLTWESEDGAPQTVSVLHSVTVGRSTGNDLVIPDTAMSRQHARIEPHAEGLTLVDLGSLNGVLVNEQRVDGSQELRDGDVITIGRTRFTVRLPREAPLSQEFARSEERTLRFDDQPQVGEPQSELPEEGAAESADHTLFVPSASPGPFPTDALPVVEEAQPIGYLIASDIRTPIYASLSVGRSEGNDIRIEDDRLVSRNHGRIEAHEDGVWLHDLGSGNGTFLNGVRVSEPVQLTDGDEIRFGATAFSFEAVAPPVAVEEMPAESAETVIQPHLDVPGGTDLLPASPREPSQSATFMVDEVQGETLRGDEAELYIRDAQIEELKAMRSGVTESVPTADTADQYRLVVNFGPDTGRQYLLYKDVTVIGRASPDADYDVQLNDRAVSRPHAKIVKEPGGFVIHDLESANGTWLNYAQELKTPRRLADGDILKIGKTTLVFRVPAALRPTELEEILDPTVGQVITLFSLKGGVGTTTLAVNLAVLLRELTQQSVVLVDLSVERGAVTVHLNLAPKLSLADLPSEPSAIDLDLLHTLVMSHESGIDVLPAPPSPQAAELVAPAAISAVLPLLRSRYKWVVVDTSTTFSELNLGVFDQSDLILLISAPDVISLKVMQSMLDTFAALQTPAESRVLVINQTYPRAHIQADDLAQALGERIGLTVPYAGDTVLDSIDRGVPMAVAYREHSAVQALEGFVGKVAQVKVQAESKPQKGGLGRWVQGVLGTIKR